MPPPSNLDHLLQQDRFDGMQPQESTITHAWLVAHGAEFDEIDFNVRLGEGVPAPDHLTDATKAMAKALTQKRADVVATRGEYVQILEVKKQCSPGALGQLLTYRHLWQEEFPFDKTVDLKVICWICDPQVRRVLETHGIEIETFPSP